MAEILTDYHKANKLRPTDFKHDIFKPSSSQHKYDKADRAHGQGSNRRLVPNHDLIGVRKPSRKSKDLEESI